MFEREYIFYGKHAEYVKSLTAKLINETSISIFNRNVDVLLFASIIGLVYRREGKIDKNGSTKEISTTKIFPETIIKEGRNINYNYELVMLLHNKDIDDIELRLDRAFRYVGKSEEFKNECSDIFTMYTLGGVEVLYEKIIGESKTTDEYLMNLYEFIEEFNIKYNISYDDLDIKDIYQLTKV